MYGELDPKDPHKTIINDIDLAPANAAGKVEYMATFFLVKPIDMSQSSHLMWQEVPNGGGRIPARYVPGLEHHGDGFSPRSGV